MNTPNAIWAVVIGTAIWIIQNYFPGVDWAGPAVAALIAVAKIIQVNLPESVTPKGALGSPMPYEQKGKVERFLTG